jgi:hypothetical protein
MRLLLIFIIVAFSSCKTSKHTKCDAYTQKEIKKDHQI